MFKISDHLNYLDTMPSTASVFSIFREIPHALNFPAHTESSGAPVRWKRMSEWCYLERRVPIKASTATFVYLLNWSWSGDARTRWISNENVFAEVLARGDNAKTL
jgi:hypothetical protein